MSSVSHIHHVLQEKSDPFSVYVFLFSCILKTEIIFFDLHLLIFCLNIPLVCSLPAHFSSPTALISSSFRIPALHILVLLSFRLWQHRQTALGLLILLILLFIAYRIDGAHQKVTALQLNSDGRVNAENLSLFGEDFLHLRIVVLWNTERGDFDGVVVVWG